MKRFLLLLTITFYINSLFAQSGLLGEYFDGTNFERKIASRRDDKIDFYWDFKSPMDGIAPEAFSIRWTAKLIAPESGQFLISLTVDDGVRMWLDGKPLINAWELHDKSYFSNYTYLEKGKTYDIKIEYYNGTREGMIKLKWQLPSEKPLFGGAFGTNEKTVSAKYFTSVDPPPSAVNVKKEAAKPKNENKKPTLKPTPAPTIVSIAPKDTMSKYTPRNILFEKGKTIMIGDSYTELDRLSVMLQRFPATKIRIEGHTDDIGDVAMNQTLSQQRADAVMSYLVQKGTAKTRLSAKGFGGSRPIYKNGNDKNRRVEFIME
jgi:outer membrane protein OmpA-like peptidoglycan-associated protein